METFEQLTQEGWVQRGKTFGKTEEYCVLAKENQVMVFNKTYESIVVPAFEVGVSKKDFAEVTSGLGRFLSRNQTPPPMG